MRLDLKQLGFILAALAAVICSAYFCIKDFAPSMAFAVCAFGAYIVILINTATMAERSANALVHLSVGVVLSLTFLTIPAVLGLFFAEAYPTELMVLTVKVLVLCLVVDLVFLFLLAGSY